MGMKAGRSIPVLLVVLTLIGCSKADLALKLKPGDKRVIEVTNNLTTTTSMFGTEHKQTMSGTQRYTYDVQSVDNHGVATVKVTADLKDMAGAGGMFSGMERAPNALRSIGEVSLTTQLARDGTVLSVTGMDPVASKAADAVKQELKDEMARTMAMAGPQAQAMMGGFSMDGMVDQVVGLVKKSMSDEAMKGQLQPFTAACSTQPVSAGSTWTKEIIMGQPFPCKITGTYKVAKRGGGLTNLEYKGDVSSDPGGGLDMGFMKITVTLSGQQSGTIQVDEATGWVTAASIENKIEGTMGMAGMSAPIKIEGNVYTKSYAQ